ncbi:hypothetical protein SE17_05735 [Kouleothrix aurantiaca]|uniref:Uncharacterized protein n=1 Tax=Kouleothrix aurantiaca TaxID=186479 RepID=A0A0P9D4U9_9CHLR|nr:hypothetical protein SE17_05735 [Kouleothrix aurantiaca]
MANITTTEVGNSLATIIAAEALGRLRANSVLSQLVARDWDNAVATYGQVVKIPFRGALTVNNKAANTNYTLQTPSDTAVSVTLNKHKEVSFAIEDLAAALARPDMLMGYISDGISALADQIDSDIAALYSTFTQTVDASAAAGPLDYTDFIESRRQLSVAKAPMIDRYAVLHPTAAAELLADVKFTNRDYRGPEEESALKTGWLGTYAGFQVFEDQNIAVATTQKNLFMHRNAIALVSRPLPLPQEGTGVVAKTMDENGIGIRVMISYQHSLGAHMATIDCLYGVGVLRNNHAVVVLTD